MTKPPVRDASITYREQHGFQAMHLAKLITCTAEYDNRAWHYYVMHVIQTDQPASTGPYRQHRRAIRDAWLVLLLHQNLRYRPAPNGAERGAGQSS
jgi:hypothetical protein